MKMVVRIGSVYHDAANDSGTYFETDEKYETETMSLVTAQRELVEEYDIYDIYEVNGIIVACVY